MILANLPPELSRHRVLDSRETAAFLGVSLPHFRRLYRTKQVPEPIRLSARKLGWRVGTLIDLLEELEGRKNLARDAA